MGDRKWLVLFFGGKRSRMSHSIATSWSTPDDGQCVTSCGLRPYDHARDPLDVTFGVDETAPRCPACVEAIEGKVAA